MIKKNISMLFNKLILSNGLKKRLFFISIISIFSILFLLSLILNYSNNIHSGIMVNGKDISNMSKQALDAYLEKTYSDFDDFDININIDSEKKNFSFNKLGISYDIEKISDESYNVGRKGLFFVKVFDIFHANVFGMDIPLHYKIDNNQLNNAVDEIFESTTIDYEEPNIIEKDNKLYVTKGKKGKCIDKDDLKNKIIKSIKDFSYNKISLKLLTKSPVEPDLNRFYTELNKEPIDATIQIVNKSKFEIVPHVTGLKTTKEDIESALNTLKSDNLDIAVINTQTIEPDLTTELLEKKLFSDTLSNFSTTFDSSTGRGTNIKLACAAINNTIILPGNQFSFNEVVGPTSKTRGYKEANTYQNGEIVPGYGGGVCQVASTLHNVALQSNMEITSRRNHTFPVSYVKSGMDATVAYGSLDYRFKNNTKLPIKINSSISGNTLNIKIVGTNETPDKEIYFDNKLIETIPYTTEYVDDPNLFVGEEKTEKNGFDGKIVKTFKIVKSNGKTLSNEMLYTSNYKSFPKKVRRGTKVKSEPAPLSTKKPVTIKPSVPAPTQPPIEPQPVQPTIIPVSADSTQEVV